MWPIRSATGCGRVPRKFSARGSEMGKEFALNTYYYSTLHGRRRAAALRSAEQNEPIQILFYHRVADECPNAWTMSKRSFARQIDWLRRRFDIVGLAEAQARIASGGNC